MAIALKPGGRISRAELHELYGGREQGGISPCADSGNVFLFMNKKRGAENGYIYDGIHKDKKTLHYTGEGRYGDQQMKQGNRAIRDHRAEGRSLHVFDVQSDGLLHHGEFEYTEHYTAEAPPRGGGDLRKVIVFKLRRLNGRTPLPLAPVEGIESGTWVREIPIEQHLTERMVITPNAKPREGERREQKLVHELAEWLEAGGHQVCRLELHAEGEPAPIRCDLFDKSANVIIEAKGSVLRGAIRMAIGQLADYSRLMENPPRKRRILLPEKPRADLIALARSQKIGMLWPDGAGGFSGES
jgi:hypothetical protein